MLVHCNGATGPGGRAENQDAIYIAAHGMALAVADGMGGGVDGGTASQLVIEAMAGRLDALENIHRDPKGTLDSALRDAHDAVRAWSDSRGLGNNFDSTLTAVVFDGHRCLIANAGDSRAYLFRKDGTLVLRTRDDSLCQECAERGEECPPSARSTVTKMVGYDSQLGSVAPAIVAEENLEEGDFLVLCSDGLHGFVEDDDIADLVRSGKSPDDVCDELMKLALANGTDDNVAAAVAKVSRVPSRRGETARRLLDAVLLSKLTMLVRACILCLLIASLAFALTGHGESQLLIVTIPERAEVVVGQVEVGPSPGPFRIGFSRWSRRVPIRVSASGYATWSGVLELVAGHMDTVIALASLPGTLDVHSSPAGATVSLNGSRRSERTPAMFIVQPGEYLIEVSLENREAWKSRCVVAYGTRETLTAHLPESKPVVLNGTLQVRWPSFITNQDKGDAELWMHRGPNDWRRVSESDGTLRLPPCPIRDLQGEFSYEFELRRRSTGEVLARGSGTALEEGSGQVAWRH